MYTCKHCDRGFADRSNMLRHVRSQVCLKKQNPKIFPCPLGCGKCYAHPENASRHKRTCKHQPAKPPSPPPSFAPTLVTINHHVTLNQTVIRPNSFMDENLAPVEREAIHMIKQGNMKENHEAFVKLLYFNPRAPENMTMYASEDRDSDLALVFNGYDNGGQWEPGNLEVSARLANTNLGYVLEDLCDRRSSTFSKDDHNRVSCFKDTMRNPYLQTYKNNTVKVIRENSGMVERHHRLGRLARKVMEDFHASGLPTPASYAAFMDR